MTHDEYVSKAEAWTDEDAVTVLEHARSCAACRREGRAADNALAPLAPNRRSHAEKAVRVLAAAAIFSLLVWGLLVARNATAPPTPARYRIVGTASGVVAETPEGLVAAGHGESESGKDEEISR